MASHERDTYVEEDLTPRKASSQERMLALWDLMCRCTSEEDDEGVTLVASSWDEGDLDAPDDILTVLERDYGLLVSDTQYDSDRAYENALQRIRRDLGALNQLFARRDVIADPGREPARTVTSRDRGGNRFTYHVERPFSAEEVFILADAIAHSRLADARAKDCLMDKVKLLHHTPEHGPVTPCMSYRPRAESSAALLATYRAVARSVDRLSAVGNRRDARIAPVSLVYGTLGPDLDLVAQPRHGGILERLLLPVAVHEDRGRYYMSARFVEMEDTPDGPRYLVHNDGYLNYRLDRVIPGSVEDWADEGYPGPLPYRLVDPAPGKRAGLTEHERYTLEASYEMYATSDPLMLELEAEGSVLKAIADSFDPDSEGSPLARRNSVRVLSDGRTRVEVPVSDGAALMGRLASFGTEAKVVGDHRLKETYARFLCGVLGSYADDPQVGAEVRAWARGIAEGGGE